MTIDVAGDEPPFRRPELAAPVFRLLALHPSTLTACLMPDHLHWLLRSAEEMVVTVKRFKSYSTRLARQAGWRGPLWQRSFWDHVVRSRESLDAVVAYIVANPVRKGWVRRWDEYPYSVVRTERFTGE